MHKMLKEIQELNEYFEARTPSSLKECEDKINNSKGGCFRFLDYRASNFFIYEDEDKKRHCKLIDYGWFISYNEANRVL